MVMLPTALPHHQDSAGKAVSSAFFSPFQLQQKTTTKGKLQIAHFISADKQLALSIIVTQAKLLLDVFNDWITFFSCSFCSTLLRNSPSVKTKNSNIVVALPDIHLALLFDT